MSVDEAQIRDMVRSVWSTQLGLEVDPQPSEAGPLPAPTMTAVVHIGGDLHGGIRLVAGRELVRRVAASMFGRDPASLTTADQRDAFGELTNIIAGNIKALLPGASSISLPTIVDGTDYTVSATDLRSSDDYGFCLDGTPFVLTVFEHASS